MARGYSERKRGEAVFLPGNGVKGGFSCFRVGVSDLSILSASLSERTDRICPSGVAPRFLCRPVTGGFK